MKTWGAHHPGTTLTEFPVKNFNQSVITHKTGLRNLGAELATSPRRIVSWAFPGEGSLGIRQQGMPVTRGPV